MNHYLNRVWTRIEHFSDADNVRDALKEWKTSGAYHDAEMPCEECELCGHSDCRYMYGIENSITKKELWTGSQCILRFMGSGLVVTNPQGQILNPKQAKKHFSQLEKQMRRETFLKQLERVAEADVEKWPGIIRSTASYFEEHDSLTPSQFAMVLWRAKETGLDFDKKAAKISFRKKRDRDQIAQMRDFVFRQVYEYLSPSQQKRALELRA